MTDGNLATKTGYVLDESKQENYAGKVKGDGSLILKVYFKQQFIVTYKPGMKGTFEEEQTSNLDYGEETPSFKGELTHQEGYEFNGWDKTPEDRVTENVEYIATWTEKEYNIVYILNGGTLGTDENGNEITNPNKYKISTETFTINNPTKPGYEFKGWTGTDLNAESKNVTIEKGSIGDRAYTANWAVIDYTITYELNGGDLGSDESGNRITNPTTYNVETPTFEINNPIKVGYTFIGWTGTDLTERNESGELIDKLTHQVIIEKGSTGNRNYEANWIANTNVEYHVQYYLEKLESKDSSNKDNYDLKTNETHFGVTDEEVTAQIKEFTGFTYDETNKNNIITAHIKGDGSLVLKVYYTRNSYTLKLEKDENVNKVAGRSIEKNLGISIDEESGEATFKYKQPIEINSTLKTEEGYDITFVKWESKNQELMEDAVGKDMQNLVLEMPAGNLTLKAISNKTAKIVGYTIEFYYQVNGVYNNTPDYTDTTRRAETDVEVFVTEEDKNPSQERPGYTFDETKNGNLSGRVKGNGTLVLEVYFKQQFKVTYKSGEHGTFKSEEEKTEEKYENLDYNSTTPSLAGTLNAQKGYEFAGWSKKVGDSVTENVEIAEKVTEDVEYIANWNTIEYTISYELNGGTLGNNENGNPITNPTSYTIETENFTLNNPTRTGYTFKGWTGISLTETNENGETIDKLTKQVTINKGSTGNRSYIANWEAIEYTITYNLDGGKLLEGANNPEKYTIETNTFTLNNPVKTGYTFKGWTGTDLTQTNESGEIVDKLTEQVTIEKGSTGNREYTANWQENTGVKYIVQYYLEKLDSEDKNNASNYHLQDVVEKSGTTNAQVNAEIKEYTGFTYDESNTNNRISGNIAGNGSLILKVYYTRNSYTLTLQKDENIENVTGESVEKNIGTSLDETTKTATFKYEQKVQIGATLKTIEGYEVTFKAWETASTQILNTQEEKAKQETTIIMPAENVIVKATSNKQANTREYIVEYYYEGNNGYEETPTYTNETPRTAKVGEIVTIADEDKIPDLRKPGYEFDENAENILEVAIPATGTATLKVYFKKSTYTLNIVAGEGITRIRLGEQTAEANGTLTGTYKYGDSITIDASYGEEEGYTIEFGKWKSNSQSLMADNTTKNLTFTMPAGDLTLTAVANKIALDTSYSVEYYYQKDGKYPEIPKDVVTRPGKTGEQAEVTPADKMPITEGYVYDNNAEGKIESTDENGIAANGTTTLRVYFKQQFTVTYKPGEHGTFEDKVIKNLDYNADIPEYTGSLEGNNGYVFDTWKLTKINEVEVTEETEAGQPSDEIETTENETIQEGETATGGESAAEMVEVEVRKVTANLEYTAMWKLMPIPTITHRPTEWTNQNVIVTITAPEPGYSIEYRIDENTNWIEYTEEFEVEQNCVIHARLAKETNKGEEVDHEINNIDKIRPQFGEKTINAEKNDEATITIKATDNLSGIVEYGITKEGYAGPQTYTCENTINTELIFDEIYENGTYTMYLKDAAGNKSEDLVEITNITGFKVARIVSAPAGYEHLIGTEYETLALALQNSDKAAQAGNVKIEIIHNIFNETNTIQTGRDYTINLNNYYVKNQEAKTTLTVDGKLRIVDENKLGNGTISSPFGLGIYISKQGELTLGEDEGGTPSTFSPIVEGLTYGIQKEIDYDADQVYDENTEKYYYPEGVFNFYDGKIIGGTAAFLVQRVNDTPALYDPTVITNTETKKQESTLAIVSGIEAVIGKKRYMLLEDAIADANNVIGDSNTQVEITIVRDIAKDADHKVVVDSTKNIKLDLNGHVFTTTANDYVLENYGKLEIYDSSETINEETGETIVGTGKITGSTNSAILNGISEETTKDIEYENIDLSKAVASGDYFFEARAEGGLISNNAGIHNSTAHSLLELDLTGKEGMYEVVTNAMISSERNCDYGYITVRADDKIVGYDNTNGRKVYTFGTADNEHKFYLVGGRKYYIQFGYRKDHSGNAGSDCFIIKGMKYGKKEVAGELTITSGIYECTKQGTNSSTGYTAVIQNESILYINGGETKATKAYIMGVYNGKNNNGAYAEINGGRVNTYHYSVLNKALAKINDGALYSSNDTSVWSDGNLYVLGENVNIKGYYGVNTQNSGSTIINAGTIYGTNSGIYNYSDNSATIINGGIVSSNGVAIHNQSNGKIEIENVTITSGSYGIYNRSNGEITISNINIESLDSNGVPIVSYGLYNQSGGKIVCNNGNIYTKLESCMNVGNATEAIIEINGGNFRTYNANNNVAYNYNGTFKMTDGTLTGSGNIIRNLYGGNIIIVGGSVQTTSEKSYAILNENYGTITIGSKDEIVSNESPTIKSAGLNAVSNRLGTFNFYDGILIGGENIVIDGVLTEIPEQSELVKELKDDGLQYVTLGMPTNYVAKISETDNPDVSELDQSYYKLENGYYYFVTLNSAVEASNTSNTTTIELIDNPWIYRTITIDEGQDITIKFNNKIMYLYAPLNFENNGNLNFINENAENVSEEERAYGNITANGGLLIKNSETADMNLDNISINYTSATGNNDNQRALINNYGKLNINSCRYSGTSSGSTMCVFGIYNRENGTININNTTISSNFMQTIRNMGNDKTDEEGNTIYALTIRNSTISDKGKNHAFIHDSEGTTLIENCNISSHYEDENQSTGNVIIRNSTISCTGIYNQSTGYIEIDNSIINGFIQNKSTGRVLIKGTDSKTKNISNLNKDGVVEIQDGTISDNSTAIRNSGILIITGGKVKGSSSNNSGIYNYEGATATISGINTEISGERGINNAGEVIIKSGSIIGKSSYYQGIYNTGKLTLGDKDGDVKYNPIIRGGKVGIENTGTFNFYDGIIEGNETISIKGVIPTETEEDCMRVIHKGEYIFANGTEEGYSVVSGREISVLEKVNIAYVISKDKYYSSLESALADTDNTDTIKIIHDASINGIVESLTIPEGKDITLDLNSYNIVAANNKTIVNNGTFKIVDSTSHTDESGNIVEGKFVNSANTILENNGTATIENGIYELTMGGDNNTYYDMFINTGTLTINNGNFTTNGTYSRIIYNSSGNVVINNGKLDSKSSNSSAIFNETGTINIKGGNIVVVNNSSNYSIRNQGNGTINIEDGIINGDIINYVAGEVNINNGEISGNISNGEAGIIGISGGNIAGQVSNDKTGTINISGGTIRYSNTGVVVNNYSSGAINITGGTISGCTTAVRNGSTGTINIDGTNLSEENAIQIIASYSGNYSNDGVYNYSSGTINIKGFVNISATAGSSYTAYGISSTGTGTINIGDSENITNNIKVSSSDYGIYNYYRNHGAINYYGGTITAPTAIEGYIDEIPEEYDIIKSVNDSNNEVYELGRAQDIVSIGGTTYNSLEEAISNNDSGTITLLKDIVYTTSEKQTINNNQNFVLDLNGHVIKLHNWEEFIINYGTLKITDSIDQQSGEIYGYAGIVIQNEGNFEMAGGKISINQIDEGKIVYNTAEGNVLVSGGMLYNYSGNGRSRNCYIIYSNNSNEINVTRGTFNVYGAYDAYNMYAIYTTIENTIVNISGGNFKESYDSRYSYLYMLYMQNKGIVNISGNVTSDYDYGIYMNKSGIVNVSDNVNLNNIEEYSIYMASAEGEVNINGGTIRKIRGNNLTIVTLTAGNAIDGIYDCGVVDVYEGVNFNVSGYAINNCRNVNIHEGATITRTTIGDVIFNCTNVNIDNATIVGNIYLADDKLNMTGGSITGTDYGIRLTGNNTIATITGGTINATAGSGILISSGTLNLGDDEGGYPSTEIPSITGSTYGVKNDGGTFNFYDGILTGSTHATSGIVTNTPEMFKVLYSADGTVAVLGIEATFEQVAIVNGVYYDDLASAIDAAVKVNGKVELCKDITTTKEITIPAGSTITIDLLGFSINGYTATGVLFTNNGTLTIIDSTNEGTNESTIRNYVGKAIVNNGTLTLGTDDDIVYTNVPKIIGRTIAVENNGNLYFLDGQIGISDEEGEVIINTGTGYKPEGYRIEKIEGTNVYTLVEE